MNSAKILTLVLTVSLCGIAAAQKTALTGVGQVDIVVEGLSDDAVKCGVTSDGIDAAVRLPLSNSRIKVAPNAISPYLYARLNVGRIGNGTCVANVHLSFRKYIVSERGSGAFWEKGTLMGGGSNFSKDVYDQVEEYTKQFIAAWLKANP